MGDADIAYTLICGQTQQRSKSDINFRADAEWLIHRRAAPTH